ncbi:MAG: aminoacyl-tRNA deacylase [Acidimicrobiia bacterium]|nr:aminoacyl-tRNA deacylase [Acidimicrobiia bacterium]
MAPKTIAARILDEAGISYELVEYDISDVEFSAELVADLVGLPPEQVFKTLVAIGDRTGPIFAVIPGGTRLDLKRLAAASGNRKTELASLADVVSLTGYQRGAVTVLGAKKSYAVIVDETLTLHDRVGISGGAKGVEIVLDPDDYILLSAAELRDIAR